jgi:hypothetical protein
MADLELGWLIYTGLELICLAIGLIVLGFGYDHAFLGRTAFTDKQTKGAMVYGWSGRSGISYRYAAEQNRLDSKSDSSPLNWAPDEIGIDSFERKKERDGQ